MEQHMQALRNKPLKKEHPKMIKNGSGITIGLAFCVFLFSFLFPCLVSFAEDLSVNGYSLSLVNISQTGGSLEVSGKLEYGPSCDKLKLSFTLKSDAGTNKTVNCFVKNAGTGSSLFKGSARVKEGETLTWNIDEVKARCADK